MDILIFAAISASVLLLSAVGFALIVQVEGFLNIAHGQMLLLGGYLGLFLSNAGLPLTFAALGAAVLSGLAGAALYGLLFKPVKAKGALVLLFTSVGAAYVIWLGIMLLAAVLIVLRSRKPLRPLHLWLLIWAILGTCLLYWINSRTSFFKPRYAWWVALAIALWAGYGLSRLPRIGRMIAAAGLALLLFVPQDIASYKEPIAAFEPTFEWLAERYRPGDVLVLDPDLEGTNLRAEVWDYYEMVYFPNGLHIVERPTTEQRRVWYVRVNAKEDDETREAVLDGRIGAEFYGRPGFFFQLFVAPPDPNGILFENGMRFHGYEILNADGTLDAGVPVWREGSTVRLRLWWSVDEPQEAEYSVGVHLFRRDFDALFAQSDGAPRAIYLQPNLPGTPAEALTAWEPGQLYVEEREIELPIQYMQRTPFTAYLTVYEWWEGGERIPAPGVNEDRLLPLFDFTLMAW